MLPMTDQARCRKRGDKQAAKPPPEQLRSVSVFHLPYDATPHQSSLSITACHVMICDHDMSIAEEREAEKTKYTEQSGVKS